MNKLEEEIISLFKQVFPSIHDLSGSEFELLTADDVDDWDSMGHLTLLAVLEQEFGVSIEDDLAVELQSYQAVVSYFIDVVKVNE
jgi:acyl carrier protein